MMTFGSTVGLGLLTLQQHAEDRMRERFIIDRPVTSGDVDDDGSPVVEAAVIYEGPGRIRSYRPHEQHLIVGGGVVTQQRPDWHIPAIERMPHLLATGFVARWSGPVQEGDRIRRLTPGRAPKTARIAGEHDVTDQTAQRFTVDELTGGAWSEVTP